jgi:CRP-like cAMP-binding protein/small-conductance mechanosensitive channel
MALINALTHVVALALAIIAIAGMYRLTRQAPRRRLRRSVLLFGFYAGALGVATALERVGAPSVARGFTEASVALEVLLVINLAAIAIFDLLLHVVRWDYPDIVHDLVVGAAYLVATAWLMHRSGLDVTSIVATSAVVTAVIGLSLQATLGNVVGGLALQVDDSIREGDWIELENKTQGQVKQVRWRHTVLETRDWDTLIVPNSQLLAQSIRVLGKRGGKPVPHRMWVYFGVDFRYAPGLVIQLVNEALCAAPIANVATDPRPHCICCDLSKEHRDSFGYYAVRYWLTNLAVDDPTSSLVRERIYAALKRAAVPLALPAVMTFVSPDDAEHDDRKRARERAFRVAALEGVELFARLSDEERRSLAEAVRPAPFARDEVITRQGATAHWLYILTKGSAEVRVTGEAGREQRVADISAPSFFGEMALMTGEPREATVVAKTDVECLRLDKDDFKAVLAHRPEIAQEMSVILAQRRVELVAVRENLDAEAKNRKLVTERSRILGSIRDFFGLRET